jgi:hypothetical protein
LQRQARFRQWLHAWQTDRATRTWISIAGLTLLLLVLFVLGYALGRRVDTPNDLLESPVEVLPP